MSACPSCGTELGPGRLACPTCGTLRHRERLEHLVAAARDHEARGDQTQALAAWREALELLPAPSGQHTRVLEEVTRLSLEVDAGPAAGKPKIHWGQLGVLGAGALLLWKFKWLAAFLLGKGKLLLLGLSKTGTVWSMVASLGLYWAVFGWWFAVGLIVSIYIHEMGHVAALSRFGIRASAPMFIPGFGALVRLQQYPADAREDARIGLAGPRWGLGAAIVASGVFLLTQAPIWAAIAAFGAWINLFNLLPFGPLDGGRGFRAMSRVQRWGACAVLVAGALLSRDGLLWLLVIVAAVRAWSPEAPQEGDRPAFLEYGVLVIAFCALLRVLPRLSG